ncbi:hypothetical protein [Noviherbaspirillum autotrophicum]|uniref:Secreted protein n=1 Tax=Noviherbaspirillum autotrophicum TaxID=709839 RepID=A0A0C2BP67_9BURK|nr:hypothetical protein [Noviherbaspirillum autotrophicum]KIF83075.1 hypothetical protein TSA66_23135 [Noviherbaspirillum autotrophicum]
MKKALIASLVSASLLSLSPMAMAAEPAATEPVQLSAAQMDGVTAGLLDFNLAFLNQIVVAPAIAVSVFGNAIAIPHVINVGGILQRN